MVRAPQVEGAMGSILSWNQQTMCMSKNCSLHVCMFSLYTALFCKLYSYINYSIMERIKFIKMD